MERLHSTNGHQQAIARSSLAEVLIHHGVPAVLGMRDSIADREALSFIQTFAQALASRMSVDRAVAVARQQLLTLYKFNQPAWTLPVLYMHPEFDGQLTEPVDDLKTDLPLNSSTWLGRLPSSAYLRGRDRPNAKSTESANQVCADSRGYGSSRTLGRKRRSDSRTVGFSKTRRDFLPKHDRR